MRTIRERYAALSTPSKAAIWFAFCGILQKGMQFLTTPLFTRLLTTAQYGEVNIYHSWYSIISVFITLNLYMGGFNNGMLRYEDRREEYLSAMQGLVTVISAGVFIVYFFSRTFWNKLFEMTTLTVTVMFVEILVHSALLFWSARERYEYSYRRLIIYTIPVTILPPVAACIAIIVLPPDKGAFSKIYANAAMVFLLCLPLFIRNIRKGNRFFDKELWRFGAGFNIPLIPHYLSGILLNQADRIMIQKMVGEAEAGIYSLAYAAAMVLNVVTTALNQTLSPWIYDKLKCRQHKEISRVTTPIFLGVAVVILMLITFAPECVIIFGGNKYKDSIWVIPSVAASLYFIFVYQVFSNIEFYFMKNKYITYASVSGALLNIILNYIAIKRFGYVAAGYTTLICYIVFAVSHSMFVRKVERDFISGTRVFNVKAAALIGVALVIISQLMLLLYNHAWIRYLVLLASAVGLCLNRKEIIAIITEMRKKS